MIDLKGLKFLLSYLMNFRRQEDIHWKEISAAMALTSLARGSSRYPFH